LTNQRRFSLPNQNIMNDLKTAKSNFPRTSVIQLNPAYLTQSGSSTSSIAQRENEDESEDEIVNVDEPDEMETEATDAQRLVSELAVQSSPEKVPPVVDINDVVRANTSPSPPPRQRRSPKARFDPYRKETDENENRMCNKRTLDNVLSVVEEIKKQAALTAQKPAHHKSQPYLSNQVGKLVLSSKPSGESAPNAVIRLNKNNNRNDDVGVSFASEECQNRPFKCHPCNIAFRISGHLSRHIKSRGHQLKISQDEQIRILPEEKPMQQDEPIDLSINSKKVDVSFKVTPPTPEILSRVTPPKQENRPVKTVTPPKPIRNQKIEPEKIEVTENGSRRFRCGICDIGFRFQGHLDRHMRSTTHLSMEEAVKRTGRRPNAQE